MFVAWRNWTDARPRYVDESDLFENGIDEGAAIHFSRSAPEKMYVLTLFTQIIAHHHPPPL